MAGFTDAAEAQTLDAWFGSQVLGPATWYVELMTAAHADAGTGGTPVSGGNYSRIAVTNNATNFPAASGGSKSNGTAINSATSSAAWGTPLQLAFYEAASGGTPKFLFDVPVGNRQNIDAANQVWQLPAGALTMSLD